MTDLRPSQASLTRQIGEVPYRMALAGGWIDQPLVSRWNPAPCGSMVVARLQPLLRFMERSGMATGTREVAMRLWGSRLPEGDPAELVRQLYAAENQGRADPLRLARHDRPDLPGHQPFGFRLPP